MELGRLGVNLTRSRSLKACQVEDVVAVFELFYRGGQNMSEGELGRDRKDRRTLLYRCSSLS